MEVTVSGFRFPCLVISLAVFVITGNSGLYAHHAISIEHDTTRTHEVTGIIKETDWNNPHAFVRLDVSGKTWLVTLLSPNALQRHGLDRSSLEVGKTLSAVGYPNRTQDEVYAQSITIDGKTIVLFSR